MLQLRSTPKDSPCTVPQIDWPYLDHVTNNELVDQFVLKQEPFQIRYTEVRLPRVDVVSKWTGAPSSEGEETDLDEPAGRGPLVIAAIVKQDEFASLARSVDSDRGKTSRRATHPNRFGNRDFCCRMVTRSQIPTLSIPHAKRFVGPIQSGGRKSRQNRESNAARARRNCQLCGGLRHTTPHNFPTNGAQSRAPACFLTHDAISRRPLPKYRVRQGITPCRKLSPKTYRTKLRHARSGCLLRFDRKHVQQASAYWRRPDLHHDWPDCRLRS